MSISKNPNPEYFQYETLTSAITDIDTIEDRTLRLRILQTEFALISNKTNYDVEFLEDIIARATHYQRISDYSTGEISYGFFEYHEE